MQPCHDLYSDIVKKMRSLDGIRHLGYDDCEISIPARECKLQWIYVREPPHGDGVFKVCLNGTELPGEFWGRNLTWCESGKYVALERSLPQKSELLLLDTQSGLLHKVADNSSAQKITGSSVIFKSYGTSDAHERDIQELINRPLT